MRGRRELAERAGGMALDMGGVGVSSEAVLGQAFEAAYFATVTHIWCVVTCHGLEKNYEIIGKNIRTFRSAMGTINVSSQKKI